MAGYWADRNLRIQDAIADKTIEEIEAQLAKYYESTAKRLTKDFEATYNKIMAKKAEGKNPTPADLYKLDKYWQLMAQLSKEGERLGNKQIALMEKAFKEEWEEIYEETSLPSDLEFATLSEGGARAMVDSVWLADGKTFSERVWSNVNDLVSTLNNELIHCVAAGKKITELSDKLQERFEVSRGRANTLVRTEVAHIQTEAAKQRYEDAGLTHYEFLGREEHDIGCDCKKLNGKIFSYKEYDVGRNAPPLHPNCRCAIAPVVDVDLIKETEMEEKKVEKPEEKKPISAERKKELIEKANTINPLNSYNLYKEVDGEKKAKEILKSRYANANRTNEGNKALFIQQLEATSRKKINKGEKREIKEMIADWTDSMFKRCTECGRVFIKDNPKSNRATRCPECQALERKRQKAADKKRVAEEKKRKKYEAKRKADKAAWARKNRAKKKAMQVPEDI